MPENLTPFIAIAITSILSLLRTQAAQKAIGDWVAKVPTRLQFLPPLALGMIAAAGEGFLSGRTGEDLFVHAMGAGAEAGALAIAIWHVVKRVKSGVPNAPGAGAMLLVASLGAAGLGSAGCSRVAVDNQIDKALLFEHQVMAQVGYLDSVFQMLVSNPELTAEAQAEYRAKFAAAKELLTDAMTAKDAALLAAKEANAETVDLTSLVGGIVSAVQSIIELVAAVGASPLLVQEQHAKALTLGRGL